MKIIKIDRDSIEINPSAGNTRDYLQGIIHASFEIESKNIPEWLSEEPFYPTEWEDEKMKGEISGEITDEMIEKFKTTKGLSISILQEPIIIDHLPEPKYLFEYIETFLKCKHCKNKINVDDIEEDWINDDYPVKVCPICRYIDSFPEYKYEQIEAVIK